MAGPQTVDHSLVVYGNAIKAAAEIELRVSRALQQYGVTTTEYLVLKALEKGPSEQLPMSRLAEATGVSSGAMTKIMDRLEKKCLARRVRADDRRVIMAQLAAPSGLLAKFDHAFAAAVLGEENA